MPIEMRSNSAVFRRAEQLKRWEESETNNVPSSVSNNKKAKIQFSDGCVFLAACAAGDTDEVLLLLEKNTDINTSNVDGLTALHQACIDNNLEMVQFLVEHGCDVNRGDNEGWTPLHATASCGSLSIARYLIENNANPAAVNNDGDLPIDIAEASEMEEYLSNVLDEQGIDCDEARSEEENIMLKDAKLMVSSALDLNDKVHQRTCATPLHVAAAKGYMEVVKLLIQAGIDLNAQDMDGWTPLHAAAHWSQKEACALLADSLCNMDIQNFAGQTCFDVAEPETVTLLEELKKKQASMQKDRPEIQAILQRTSNRPPLKRRTSVTRMSGQEKSKSVIKDTKYERAHIESLSLPEEENEEDKEKRRIESLDRLSGLKSISAVPEEKSSFKKAPPLEKQNVSEVSSQPDIEKIPSWKKVLRRSADESADSDVAEVVLKRPKKIDDNSEKSTEKSKDGRIIIPPIRDEESELQRKAHAKRVRETRRSTQGVLLEDIKSAELQFLINTQQEAAKRQADEAQKDIELEKSENTASNISKQRSSSQSNIDSKEKQFIPTAASETNVLKPIRNEPENKIVSDPSSKESDPSVTLSLRTKTSSSPEEISYSDVRNSLGTQAAIQRRKRPKRRSTGVVHLDSDDAEKDPQNDSSNTSETGHSDRSRHRYGSSASIPDISTETSVGADNSVDLINSKPRANVDTDFEKLYEEMCKVNEKFKGTIQKIDEELEKTRKQLVKSQQEKRTLERKVSEMEEEIKQIEKLKMDNDRLKDENAALIRVISKLSK